MEWTKKQWDEWQASNRRLLDEGWVLGTKFKFDGSVQEYAIRDGIEIDRTPECWKERIKTK